MEIKEHNADETRKFLDNLPTPPQGEIPKSEPVKPEEEKKEEKKSKIDPEIAKTIQESIMEGNPNVKWDDIKGLIEVKKILNETIVLP